MSKLPTKGEKISRWLWIKDKGTSIVGCMTWETPYIRFHAGDPTDLLIWQSDNIGNLLYILKTNECVYVTAFKYNNHLRRVTIKTEDGKIYGMIRK